MPDYYCDHGAYASVLGTVPTWGVPQEGDGSTKDAATASSIGSVLFASVPTSGAVSVFGADVTLSGVLGAASVDAAANALASSINNTTNLVTSGFAVGTPRLQNLVYARGPAGGAPAGTCQIMCRVGSATLNVTGIVSSFNGSPTLTQFSGGSGGCWGWFFNTVPLGVSNSIPVCTYGSYSGTTLVIPAAPDWWGDKLWFRTGGGASKFISYTVPTESVATPTFNMRKVFDTNTKWTSDSPTGQLKLSITSIGNYTSLTLKLCLQSATSAQLIDIEAVRQGGFALECIVPGNYYAAGVRHGDVASNDSAPTPFANGSSQRYKRISAIDAATVGDASFFPFGINATYGARASILVDDCTYDVSTPRATLRQLWYPHNNQYSGGRLVVRGGRFNYNINTPSDPGAIMGVPINNGSASLYVHFRGVTFEGYASGYSPLGAINTDRQTVTDEPSQQFVFEDCKGLRLPDTYTPNVMGISMRSVGEISRLVSYSSVLPGVGLGFRNETRYGVAEWLPNVSPAFPTLSAIHQVVGSPWSVRLITLAASPLFHPKGMNAPEIKTQVSLADGVRTFTLNLLKKEDATLEMSVSFHFIDVDDVPRVVTTEVISSSTASWTGATNYPSHAAKKMEVSSGYSVPQGGIVTCCVSIIRAPTETVSHVYIDPEIVIA